MGAQEGLGGTCKAVNSCSPSSVPPVRPANDAADADAPPLIMPLAAVAVMDTLLIAAPLPLARPMLTRWICKCVHSAVGERGGGSGRD